jgi:O-succinylbenzoate synthase
MSGRRYTVQAYTYALPFVRPWRYAHAVLNERTGLVLRIEDRQSGRAGWGEAAPLPGFGVEEPRESLAGLAQVRTLVSAAEPAEPAELLATLEPALALTPALRCAVSTALLSLGGGPLRRCWAPAADVVHCNRMAGAVLDPPQGDATWRVIKLKLGLAPMADEAAAALAWARALPDARFRLDVGGAWTVAQAQAFIHALGDDIAWLELLEQPVAAADLDGLVSLCDGRVPIGADESACTEVGRRHLAAAPLAAIVAKPMVWGGPDRVVDFARSTSTPVIVTTSLESVVGRWMCAQVAAVVDPAAARHHGLATGSWLARDLDDGPGAGQLADAPTLVLGDEDHFMSGGPDMAALTEVP